MYFNLNWFKIISWWRNILLRLHAFSSAGWKISCSVTVLDIIFFYSFIHLFIHSSLLLAKKEVKSYWVPTESILLQPFWNMNWLEDQSFWPVFQASADPLFHFRFGVDYNLNPMLFTPIEIWALILHLIDQNSVTITCFYLWLLQDVTLTQLSWHLGCFCYCCCYHG